MTTFLSTYVNKVDRKGRVSVPAPYRAALAQARWAGIVGYPSLSAPAYEAMGRDALDTLTARRFDHSLEGGNFEAALLGGGDDTVETILAMSSEMAFDSEGRVVLPAALISHTGITESAAFVGRGSRFQIWAPDAFEQHQSSAIDRLRARMADGGGS